MKRVARPTVVVPPKNYIYAATVLSIHDGDTVNLAVRLSRTRSHNGDLGFHIHIENGWLTDHISGRLLGLNAPELATQAGKDSLAFLESLIAVGDLVSVRSSGPSKQPAPDKFGGRWDVVIVRGDGVVINDEMVTSGHAASWDGKGTKPV